MAEYMLVPNPRLLLPLGDLDPLAAAPLSDAALTPYHAIKRSLRLLHPGATVVVIGVGGLGHMAVQILRAITAARVIALDTSADKLRLAAEIGAEETVPAGEDAAEQIRSLTGGRGAELVLDHVGAEETIALGAEVVRMNGEVTVVGLAGGKIDFGFGTMPFDATLTVPYWGSAIELMEVLDLARAGRIRAHVERFALDEVEEAYRRLRDGSLDGRAVVCPHG
jgi:propanol-preferring alcohol dehydrogenase